jgi:TolB-like protein
VSMSGQEEGEYFADGIQEALISELAHISSLRVISRTSSMQYKRAKQSLSDFAQALQLDLAVEGSVLLEGNRVRINVRLIDAVNDTQLWAQSYDRPLRDVLDVQSEVAESIAQRIELKLSPSQQSRLRNTRAINPEAHAAYLKGRYYWHQFFTEAGMKKAIEYLRLAIELEPGYSPAWAYLSACFTAMGVQAMLPPEQAQAEAKPAAERALALAPLSAEAHVIMAANCLFFDWNWAATEGAILKAIELNPSCEAHGLFAHYALARGWCEQAIVSQRRALDLDPMSATMSTDLVWAHLLSRDYGKAIELSLGAEGKQFNYPLMHFYLGQAYLCIGEYRKGIAEIERIVAPGEHASGPSLAMLGHAYGVAGKKSSSKEILSRMEELSRRSYVASYDWAVLHAGFAEKEAALQRLKQAVDEREPRVIWLKLEPAFESVRKENRFQDLIRRLELD